MICIPPGPSALLLLLLPCRLGVSVPRILHLVKHRLPNSVLEDLQPLLVQAEPPQRFLPNGVGEAFADQVKSELRFGFEKVLEGGERGPN